MLVEVFQAQWRSSDQGPRGSRARPCLAQQRATLHWRDSSPRVKLGVKLPVSCPLCRALASTDGWVLYLS